MSGRLDAKSEPAKDARAKRANISLGSGLFKVIPPPGIDWARPQSAFPSWAPRNLRVYTLAPRFDSHGAPTDLRHNGRPMVSKLRESRIVARASRQRWRERPAPALPVPSAFSTFRIFHLTNPGAYGS